MEEKLGYKDMDESFSSCVFDTETPKYKKKMNSSVSKSGSKSKHKHEYTECLFIEKDCPHRGNYCTICGKIGAVHFFEVEKMKGGLYRQLNNVVVFERYKHLVRIEVADIFQKYVPISDESIK